MLVIKNTPKLLKELYTLYVNTNEFNYHMAIKKIQRGEGRRYTSTLNTTD